MGVEAHRMLKKFIRNYIRGSTYIFFILLCNAEATSQNRGIDYHLKISDKEYDSGNFENALYYLDTAAHLALELKDLTSLVEVFSGKGQAYRYNYNNTDLHRAYQYFYLARKIAQIISDYPSHKTADLFYHLATTQRRRLNYQSALAYADSAFSLGYQQGSTVFQAKLHNMLANILQDQSIYDSAVWHYERAIHIRSELSINDDYLLAMYHSNFAQALKNARRFGKSVISTKKALQINLKFKQIDSTEISVLQRLLGVGYHELRNYNKAAYHFNQAKLFGNTTNLFEAIARYRDLGTLYFDIAQPDSALHYYDMGLKTVFQDIWNRNQEIARILATDSLVVFSEEISHLLTQKAKVFDRIYNSSQDTVYLQKATDIYMLVDEIMLKRRMNALHENTSLHLAGHFKDHYENALNSFYQFHRLQGEDQYISTAFSFIERNKHLTLLQKQLEIQRRGFEEEIVLSIQSLNTNNIAGIAEIDALIRVGSNLTPNQPSTQMNEFFEVNKLQEKLFTGQLMLNYFWGDEHLYLIAVTNQNTFFDQINLKRTVAKFRAFMNQIKKAEVANARKNYLSFTKASYELYQMLIEPALEWSKHNNELITEIIIVPDVPLSTIPFGALIQSEPNVQIDYRDQNYLIRDFNIAQSLSASLHLIDERGIRTGSDIYGFSYTSLSGAKREVIKISDIWPKTTHVFKGADNTESNFKMRSGDPVILHIASHAGSGLNGKLPGIEFEKHGASDEDGILYANEVYQLDLATNLTVLSACETGVGKFIDGEGIFSLARGFIYAGSPTVLLSLWNVSDSKTENIMVDFYKALSQQATVAESLRLAQLKYLDNSDEINAHPANWAAFVVIGRGSQIIQTDQGFDPRIVIMSTLLGLILCYGLVRIAKTRFKSGN